MQQVQYNTVSAENGETPGTSNTLQGRVCQRSLKNVIIIVIVSTIAVTLLIGNIVQAANQSHKAICPGDDVQHSDPISQLSFTDPNTKTPFDDWIKYKGMDYYFSEGRRNWTSSRDFCLQHGAQLAVLKDKQIKKNVQRFFKYSDNYWCGLQRKNGSWYWLGDLQKANEQIDDHINMDCATINSANKKYDASNCADPRYFVCIK